jgi:hypothetical protein
VAISQHHRSRQIQSAENNDCCARTIDKDQNQRSFSRLLFALFGFPPGK